MNPIVDKIKKLLRMNRGGTEAEIATALALAQQLARKHGIEIASVNPNEEAKQENLTHAEIGRYARVPTECIEVCRIAQTFFNVHVIVGWQITFVGTRTDIDIATYIYGFLVRHFRERWRKQAGWMKSKKCFMRGMGMGVSENLWKEKRNENVTELGLVLASASKREAYIENEFGKLPNKKFKDAKEISAEMRAGFRDGLNTQIRPGLEALRLHAFGNDKRKEQLMSKNQRSASPMEFALWLVSLARIASEERKVA